MTGISIDNVENPSGDDGGYSDLGNISLIYGSTVPVILTPGFSGKSDREFWRIWIDFNNDFDFDDTGEVVFVANNTKSVATGSISIPSTSASETTKMRISMKMGTAPMPCEIFSRGEVEDYTVSFLSGFKSSKVATNTEDESDKISEPSFYAYPNPVSDKLFVELNAWEGKKLIRLYDLTGKVMYFEAIEESNIEIDISFLPKGIYFLNVENRIFIESIKIIIH